MSQLFSAYLYWYTTVYRSPIYWTCACTGYIVGTTGTSVIVRKTIDGGKDWSTVITIEDVGATGIAGVSAWAEWETPNDTGTRILIAYVDYQNDKIKQAWLDTSDDSHGVNDVTVALVPSLDFNPGYLFAQAFTSITKSRGGNIHIDARYHDITPLYHQAGYWSDDDGATWNTVGTSMPGLGVGASMCALLPGNETDPDDIWSIVAAESTGYYVIRMWDHSAGLWGAGVNIHDAGTLRADSAKCFTAAIRHSDGHAILVCVNDDYDDDAFSCYDINGTGSITYMGGFTSAQNCSYPDLCINQDNDNLYLCYLYQDNWYQKRYAKYAISTDGGAGWSYDIAWGGSLSDNYRWMCCSIYNSNSWRWMGAWFEDDNNTIDGTTFIYTIGFGDIDDRIRTGLETNSYLKNWRNGPLFKTGSIGYKICTDGLYKTINGGQTWTRFYTFTNTVMQADQCADWEVPGDTGQYIHFVVIFLTGTNTRTCSYLRFNTETDSLTEHTIRNWSGNISLGSRPYYQCSITKTTSGNLAVGLDLSEYSGDYYNPYFYISPDNGASWNSKNHPYTGQRDCLQLYPGNAADPDDVWGLFLDYSTLNLYFAEFDNSLNSWTKTLIGVGIDASNFVTFHGAVRHSDGHLLAAQWNATDATADLLTWDINGAASIVAKTDVVTNQDFDAHVCIVVDNYDDEVYVGYSHDSKVYYRMSGDDMASWGAETQITRECPIILYVAASGSPIDGGRFAPCWIDDDFDEVLMNRDYSPTIGRPPNIPGPGGWYPRVNSQQWAGVGYG